ncbi:glycine-rich cell wall structural protein 1 [Drosophila hydei]|uniref:Glycine-rich cell wall structural protein 1 n=1 Tax=Drosophila hydei TaxID=7224 RepID=A0A6J1M9H4_DROHY|nr:glycine-rich cell wall structural protein 1 [Drosophila hydei]
MSLTDRRSCIALWICALSACLASASAQNGGVTWNAGNAAGAGAWSNSQAGGAHGMHAPGSLGGADPQYSFGYAGIDSRGPYGGAGGNGAYYVSGTDEHGRPFSYNGGVGGQPMPPPPGYPNSYGYRSAAGATVASVGVALALALLAART